MCIRDRNSLEQDLEDVYELVDSGNLNVDAILNSKLSMAIKKEIALDYKATVPSPVSYTHLGRGTAEYCGVEGRVDIITGTLGKALGGASGGFTAARQEIVDLLRQRSRPYLFSNTLAPAIVAASLEVFKILEADTSLRDHLEDITAYYRQKMTDAGFDIIPGVHPIVPVMLYDEKTAGEMAKRMMDKGIYVVAFSYPVVPKGKARIRTQVSAAHTRCV